jgi:DNA-binding transcriptional ArsR family regulator
MKAQQTDRPVRTETIVDQNLIKALGHPLRVRILAVLNERTISPSDLAEELDVSLSDVSYHVRELLRFEQIELVKTRPRRGAVEHYYRGVRRAMIPTDAWSQLPPAVQQAIAGHTFELIMSDAAKALAADAYTRRPDSHISWTPLTLDEQGWTELMSVLDVALDQVLEVQAQASGRLAESGASPTVSTTVGIAGFESTRGG